jgi:aerobic carbon-monoxide dehydrogenase large subunit
VSTRVVGTRVARKEDPVLVTGHGRFVDDIEPEGTLHATFVRCPIAHARITSIDAEAARDAPGVHAVYTGADLGELVAKDRLPLLVPNPLIVHPITQQPLVTEEVRYVGEPVAMVVADDRYLAEDAAELVMVDYEELAPVADLLLSAGAGSGPAHAGRPDNVAARIDVGYGDTDAAFAKAAHVVRQRYDVHRGTAHPMECRAVLAEVDPTTGKVAVQSTTQAPHLVKRALVEVLGVDEDEVRVAAPHDVGGGFGPKVITYPEEMMVPAAARKLRRPIKWAEDRREHFTTTTHERDQHWDVEAAFDGGGKLLGIRGSMLHDTGAYLPWGIISPYIASTTLPGPYVLPSYRLRTDVMFTNTTPTTPVRGAGRPQAVFVMERLLDQAADELDLDRAEIRRRNFITADQMPYEVGLTFRDGSPVVYDSGDYPATLEAALRQADYDDFRARQAAARAEGRSIGIGMACYVEGTGLGPFEGATIRIHKTGEVVVYTGAAPQGQGHQTTLAQLAAEQLGIEADDVRVVTGDTDRFPHGIGTFASRIAVNAGNSVHMAAIEVRDKILKLAADLFEVSEDDLELVGGGVQVRGDTSSHRGFASLATAAGGMPGFALKVGDSPGLEATSYFLTPQATYAHGAHVAEVEVDAATGATTILRYVIAHDCGTVIHPTIVEGQIQGGLAQGIGNALFERMLYDDNAQPTTTTFGDYLLPLATDVPKAEIVHLESPTPLNPLGVKGAGEGGTIPAAAAVISAIEDALGHLDVARFTSHPATPYRVLRQLRTLPTT